MSTTTATTAMSSRQNKRPAVPLLLEAFPVPPSHIPPTPTTPSGSSTNPPLTGPPSTPLPPVPGPSRISEHEQLLLLSSAVNRSRRSSKYSLSSKSSHSPDSRRQHLSLLSDRTSIASTTSSLSVPSLNGPLLAVTTVEGADDTRNDNGNHVEQLTRMSISPMPYSDLDDEDEENTNNHGLPAAPARCPRRLSPARPRRQQQHHGNESISEIDMREVLGDDYGYGYGYNEKEEDEEDDSEFMLPPPSTVHLSSRHHHHHHQKSLADPIDPDTHPILPSHQPFSPFSSNTTSTNTITGSSSTMHRSTPSIGSFSYPTSSVHSPVSTLAPFKPAISSNLNSPSRNPSTGAKPDPASIIDFLAAAGEYDPQSSSPIEEEVEEGDIPEGGSSLLLPSPSLVSMIEEEQGPTTTKTTVDSYGNFASPASLSSTSSASTLSSTITEPSIKDMRFERRAERTRSESLRRALHGRSRSRSRNENRNESDYNIRSKSKSRTRAAGAVDSEPSLPEPVGELPALPASMAGVGAFGKGAVGMRTTRTRRGSEIGMGLPSEVRERGGPMTLAEFDESLLPPLEWYSRPKFHPFLFLSVKTIYSRLHLCVSLRLHIGNNHLGRLFKETKSKMKIKRKRNSPTGLILKKREATGMSYAQQVPISILYYPKTPRPNLAKSKSFNGRGRSRVATSSSVFTSASINATSTSTTRKMRRRVSEGGEDRHYQDVGRSTLRLYEHEKRERSDDVDGDSDSSLDLHTPLPHLMVKHGLLSPYSKLLPGATSRASTPMDGRPGSIISVASNGSLMTKSGIIKDERDTPNRRIRHRDRKLLRGGIGLTTGLGWSDSEDEDAPSPLTRRLSTLNLSSRPSSLSSSSRAQMGLPHPLSRSVSSSALMFKRSMGMGMHKTASVDEFGRIVEGGYGVEEEEMVFGDEYVDDDDGEDNTLKESGEWAQRQRMGKGRQMRMPYDQTQTQGGQRVRATSTGSSISRRSVGVSRFASASTSGVRTPRATRVSSGLSSSVGTRTSTSSVGSTFSLEVTPAQGEHEGSTPLAMRTWSRDRDRERERGDDGHMTNTPTSTSSTLSIPMPATPRDGVDLEMETEGAAAGFGMDKEKSLPPLPPGGLKKMPSSSKLALGVPRTRTYSATATATTTMAMPPVSPSPKVRPLQLPRQAATARGVIGNGGDRPAVPVPSVLSSSLSRPSLRSLSAAYSHSYSHHHPHPRPPTSSTSATTSFSDEHSTATVSSYGYTGLISPGSPKTTTTMGIASPHPRPRTGTGMVYRTSSSSSVSAAALGGGMTKIRAPLSLSGSISSASLRSTGTSSKPGGISRPIPL